MTAVAPKRRSRVVNAALLSVLALVIAGACGWWYLVRHDRHWGKLELLEGRYAGSWHVAWWDRGKLAGSGFPHERLRIEIDRVPNHWRETTAAAIPSVTWDDPPQPGGQVSWDDITCPMQVETMAPFSRLWVRCPPPDGERPFGDGLGSDGFTMDLLVTRGALEGATEEDLLYIGFVHRELASLESLEGACICFVRD